MKYLFLDNKVYYSYKKYGKEERYKYSILKTIGNHTCDIKKSSGETIIEDYLKIQKIKYKTQGDTLKYKNPETKHNLPYNFELTVYKIIIEVQGEQHREFIEYFHGTYDNFEYQLRRNKYKKDNAIKHGYQYEDTINERTKT